jgi:Secretin and TonB N terminus short domain
MYRILLAALMLVLIWAQGVAAQEMPSSAGETLSYGIASQDLAAAIKAYVRISGMQVLFETAVTADKRSTALNGRFTAAQALKVLLSGTGLTASRTDVDAFVIAPDTEAGSLASRPTMAPDARFLAALQQGVLDVLCRDPLTRPGSYKVAVELWIAPDAIIQRTSLIGSTQDGVRDRALLEGLRGASIGLPPPPNLPQPFVIRIKPRNPRETGDCAG